ncbi:2188_t:CDS:1, partial [Scutellospora calospora]
STLRKRYTAAATPVPRYGKTTLPHHIDQNIDIFLKYGPDQIYRTRRLAFGDIQKLKLYELQRITETESQAQPETVDA